MMLTLLINEQNDIITLTCAQTICAVAMVSPT